MPKYQYSVIRFVPSPTRGEFVNLGIIVGSDATDEWTMDLVGKKNRAAKLDDAGILPLVSTELERLQLRFPSDDEETPFNNGPEISEVWLAEMASQCRNVVQYTPPQPILASDATTAMEKLWTMFIVDHVRQKRESLTKHQIRTRYLKSLQQFDLTSDLEALVGDPKRIKLIAANLVEHFEKRLEAMDGIHRICRMKR